MKPFDSTFVRITNADGEDAGIGVEVLAQVLVGLQKALYALATPAPDGPDAPPFKPSGKFKRRYALRCLTRAVEGDRLPVSIGPRQLELDLALGVSPNEVLGRLLRVWEAIALDDESGVALLVPDAGLRQRCLESLAKALPKTRETWRVALVLDEREIPLDASHGANVAAWAGVGARRDTALMTIIGELVGVDFTAGTFGVRYAPTGRTITGRYAPESEVWLLKHRRKLIRVTAECALDEDDLAHAIKRVTQLAEIDLSPITVQHLALEGRGWEFVPPLVLTPVLDATQQAFELIEEPLSLSIEAGSREELSAALRPQLERLWRAVLRGEAPELARAWQRRLKEVQGAILE